MTRNRRYQHGSIYKRVKRKKMWVARWWEDVIAPNGTVERLRRSENLGSVAEIPTRREAARLLAERLRPINSSEFRPKSSCMFEEYAETIWKPEVMPSIKHSTKKGYNGMLRFHLYPAFGRVQLRLITRGMVQMFLSQKLAQGLSSCTVRHLRTMLGTVLGCCRDGRTHPIESGA